MIVVATGALEIDGAAPEKTLRALIADGACRAVCAECDRPGAGAETCAAPDAAGPGPARFAALSARVGSIGDNRLGGWYGYRAAKAALNQLIHTAAIEIARTHPQAVLVCLHPGTVATRLHRSIPGTASGRAARDGGGAPAWRCWMG